MRKFKVKSLGEVSYFLGVRILRDQQLRKSWLVQDSYIDKLASKFKVTLFSKPLTTPLPTEHLLPNTETTTKQEISLFQQLVGSMNFAAVFTRPDIAFSMSVLSQFMTNPSGKHLDAAKHCLSYLVATKFLAVEFDSSKRSKGVFVTYSDAAFADDKMSRFSSFGFALQLFGGIIHYKASKLKTVTLSSTEAELLALTSTAREFVYWMRLFDNIGLDLEEKSTIYCDNIQTIGLLQKESFKLKTALKHVDIHSSWIRQEVQRGRIDVEYVPTAEMVADGFTKLLPRQKFQNFLKQLNMSNIETRVKPLENSITGS